MLLHISKLPPVGLKLGQVPLAGLYQLALFYSKSSVINDFRQFYFEIKA